LKGLDMRLYQSPEGIWTGTQADAKAQAKATGTPYEEVDVPVDKAGLMAFLNRHRVGAAAPPVLYSGPPVLSVSPPSGIVSYSDQSIAIDDAWEELPLARKLHFAALAMEDARSLVK
jgi:hypothetical protein